MGQLMREDGWPRGRWKIVAHEDPVPPSEPEYTKPPGSSTRRSVGVEPDRLTRFSGVPLDAWLRLPIQRKSASCKSLARELGHFLYALSLKIIVTAMPTLPSRRQHPSHCGISSSLLEPEKSRIPVGCR
jgi:hypothetical protein